MNWSGCPAVETDPQRLGGTPVLAGTRMPVEAILDIFVNGTPLDEIADNYQLPLATIEELFRFVMHQALTRAA